jgi:type IV secretory pathway component VirB8
MVGFGKREVKVEAEPTARPMGETYPGAYDSGHSWRNWHPTARLLAVICGVQAGVIISLTGLIVSLFPLKTIDPVYLTIASDTKFAVEASRLHDRTDAVIEMQAAWIRRWVDFRFGVIPDNSSMGIRALWIKEHSSIPIWSEFEKTRPEVNEAIRNGNQRDVLNMTVTRTGNDFWIVDFSLQDTVKGRTEPKGRYRATVRVQLIPPKEATRSEASRQIDPGAYLLGFFVVNASLSEV